MASLDAVRARFARNEGLPFADVLTETSIRDVLHEQGVQYRDRVFNPVTTIWGFLSQVLSEDHGCRDAVSRIIAHRATNGQTVCSPNTASYCDARSRLLTGVLSTLAKQTAEELQMSIDRQWEWNGRSVFIVDGSTVSMPDTPKNQQEYPQPPIQEPGLGFPLARIAVLLSLATGACHDLEIASYQGKGTGEKSLFRRMYDTLKPGDMLLAFGGKIDTANSGKVTFLLDGYDINGNDTDNIDNWQREGDFADNFQFVGVIDPAGFQSAELRELRGKDFQQVLLFTDDFTLQKLTAPTMAGDFNNDNQVNAADYAVWLANLGNPAGLPNDNNLGTVGQLHYDLWKISFGTSLGNATNDAIPEPVTGVLLLLGIASFFTRRGVVSQN